MKNHKRILSVKIKRMLDDSPDTSYLGEYSNRAKTDYAIDRAHAEDCLVNGAPETDETQCALCGESKSKHIESDLFCGDDTTDVFERVDCDCGERGDMQRNEYRYFNGNVENYKGESDENIRKYIRQDYDRMERLNAGDWCYIGIHAEAEIAIFHAKQHPLDPGQVTTQIITSGGLWGIESDSDRTYLESVEKEELSDLKTQLRGLGFSTRQITQAFKSIEEVSE